MSAITEFLLARIAEDEDDALLATKGHWETTASLYPDGTYHDHVTSSSDIELDICEFPRTPQGISNGEHIARHDPARVLAECAAKRAIIGLADDVLAEHLRQRDASAVGADFMHRDVLRALAAAYSNHADYRQEWAL